MDNKITERQKRYLSLESIVFILQSADRIGAEKDEPEGSRCVSFSDTVVNKMINTLHAYIDDGFDFLIKNR